MSDLVATLRAIVRDELRSVRLGDLAVVSAIAPHASTSDTNNHECTVKLRESGLELARVPIATPHVGLVSSPRVGDLVLVSYVNGDPNRPIVAGRLYTAAARPPLHHEDELCLEAPPGGKTRLAIAGNGDVVIAAGETKITVHQDGSIEITGKQDLAIKVTGNVALTCADCTIDASGDVALGSGGSGVITQDSHKCYFTGAPLVGSATVKAKR